MSRKVTIALDAMGGDRGPVAVVPAALAVLEQDDSASLMLVGLPEVLEDAKREANGRYGSRLGFKAASEAVARPGLRRSHAAVSRASWSGWKTARPRD